MSCVRYHQPGGIHIVAEKGFKVLTAKEKYYKKLRDYYRNILGEKIDSVRFINEARML
jgi:hypothetical protein